MTKWVQHISGQGEKWKVHGQDSCGTYIVLDGDSSYYLPKSEYREVPRAVEWEDVTGQVEPCLGNGLVHDGLQLNMPITQDPQCRYRLRKVQLHKCEEAWPAQWAFIVERRKS